MCSKTFSPPLPTLLSHSNQTYNTQLGLISHSHTHTLTQYCAHLTAVLLHRTRWPFVCVCVCEPSLPSTHTHRVADNNNNMAETSFSLCLVLSCAVCVYEVMWLAFLALLLYIAFYLCAEPEESSLSPRSQACVCTQYTYTQILFLSLSSILLRAPNLVQIRRRLPFSSDAHWCPPL